MIETTMLQFEAVGYFFEILIAEILFLLPEKRRDHFFPRLLIPVVCFGGIISITSLQSLDNPFIRFAYLLVIIALSFICMQLAFEKDAFHVASYCIAGVATQHIANKCITLIVLLLQINKIYLLSPVYRILLEIIISAIVYVIIYMAFASKFRIEEPNLNSNLLSIVIVLMCIGVNRLVVDYSNTNVSYELATAIYAIICCVFALTIQFYLAKWQQQKAEAEIIGQLLAASEKQYEQWKTMVNLNNIHIHDLKHMLDKMEKLSGKERVEIPDLSPIRASINNFSPLVKTGNDVLDVLLRNMDTLCKEQDIRFNCVSYTEQLGKFDSMSLYFLFANAIDNARDGASKVTDPDKRLIDVSLKQFGDSVIIHIWNYFNGEISFDNGLPVRGDNEEGHGYGLKSIKLLVDKFEGSIKAQAEGDVFHLNIILPLKSK